MEWRGSDYDRVADLQRAMGAKALASLVLTGDERVLDVGCGDGRLTAEVAARVPRGSVVGVDPSRDMIAYAAGKYGPPVHANLTFAVGVAERLPFEGEFDRVVSFNALHWVAEQQAALTSIRRALKSDGRVLIRMVPDGARESLEDVIEETRRRPEWANYFAGFERPYTHVSPDEYRALAEQVGLRVERLDVDDEAWDFGSREGFIAFADATFVFWTGRLPVDARNAFITAVLDRYQSIVADNPREASTFKFYQMTVELVAE